MIIFYYGEDTFRSRLAAERISHAYERTMGYPPKRILLQEEAAETLHVHVQTPSLFAKEELVVARDPFPASPETLESHRRLFTDSHLWEDSQRTLLVWQAGEPDKRSRLFRDLVHKSYECTHFPLLDGKNLRVFVASLARERGVQWSHDVIEETIRRTGGDIWRIATEIDKLSSITTAPTLAEIHLYIAPSVHPSIFAILDLVATREKEHVPSILRAYYREGASPLALLSMLVYHVRNLCSVKSLLEASLSERTLPRRTKLHPYVLRKTVMQSKQFTLRELKHLYGKLYEIEHAVKRGQIDPVLAIDLFVASI
ncbi:MAG: DNA polymerase III subunit delta [Parcubacteria group bacterium]|nr:DNA polymerase III subunit delta [Parcubacteria group bacterium]